MMMKVHLVFILSVLVCFTGTAQGEDPVNFPDANFKAAVEAKLGITDPTPTDMLGLTSLDVREDNISDITGIGYATNLSYLNLSWNQLTSIPAEIGNLVNLTSLSLSYNQLTSLPPELWNLVNLTRLYLYNNQLTSILADIGNLVNLTDLRLSGNQLTSIPADIGNLVNLTRLYLSNNQLTSIPPKIGQLVNLTGLSLYNNQLTSLPAEIGNLVNLTYLWLSGNQLTFLPAEIGNFVNLTWLSLNNSQLTSLPAEIGNLVNLTDLYLWGNQLNTPTYCSIIPLIQSNNPGIHLSYDPNPNPLTDDCSITVEELADFAGCWLEADCGPENNWCGGTDMDGDGNVDLMDWAVLAEYWLAGTGV